MITTKDLSCDCPHCKNNLTSFDVYTHLQEYPRQKGDQSGVYLASFGCPKCQQAIVLEVNQDVADVITNHLEKERADEEEWIERAIEQYEEKQERELDQLQEKFGIADAPIDAEGSAQQKAETDEELMERFGQQIKKIDKNLSKHEQFKATLEALEILIEAPSTFIQAGYSQIKDEFKLTAREIEAIQRDIQVKRKELDKDKKNREYESTIAKYSISPQKLSRDEIEEALQFLRDSNLINRISKNLAFAGEIIDEESNKMMLYLSAVSRKLDKPISLVIFGQSSSGKSWLANSIGDFIPDEDRIRLSSASDRAIEYLGSRIKHKWLLVQEFEGIQNILPTIRTLQSEGRLNRLVTIQDPETGRNKSISQEFECPCTVVFTTTREGIHDENATRIFELYADESLRQTQQVVNESILKADINYRANENKKKQIIKLHQNAQRLLEKIKVSIPFTQHLSWPSTKVRSRRDVNRFLQLVKTVAFLRQKQKQIKFTPDGTRYIEADLYDYEVAYNIGISVVRSTINPLSDRAKRVLTVCCDLADDYIRAGQQPIFTVSHIQEKGKLLGYDIENRTDLYKQLDKLEEYEYLQLHREHSRATKFYSVAFQYVRDQTGRIINIDSPDIKDITTPSELREKHPEFMDYYSL